MADTIRMGLVGFGRCNARVGTSSHPGRGEGLFHVAASSFPGVEPAAICDKNPDALEQARLAYPKADLYEDFDAMIHQADLTAIIIATPAHLHARFAVGALNHHVHVMSEIPCVDSLEEAWSLWEAQQNSRAFYMTGANANMKGFIETALDLKKRGLLGDPFYVETAYLHDVRKYFDSTPWRRTYESIRYCTHSLGPVLRILDQDLAFVSCFDTGSHVNKQPDEHDAMTALFRTSTNVVVHLLTSFINNYPNSYAHYYRFLTTKGAFERTMSYQTQATWESAAQPRTLFYTNEFYGNRKWIELPVDASRPDQTPGQRSAGHGGMDYALLEQFVSAIRANGPSPINLREGLRMTLPGIYAAASAATGGQLLPIEYPWTAPRPPVLPSPANAQPPLKDS